MNYQSHIQTDSQSRLVKPCIKGTRITVYDVLGWLASGMNHQEIISDFPELKEEHILACLAFAADKEHRVQIVG